VAAGVGLAQALGHQRKISMKQTTESIKITVRTNHWRVPSVERAFDGWLEGSPSDKERSLIIKEVLKERESWAPSPVAR